MTIAEVSRDLISLPQDLLPRFKAQVHIDHCEEDEFLTDILARAIEYFEIKTESSVFVAQFSWSPAEAEFNGNGAAKSPVQPVLTMTITVPGDPSPVDVTANYVINARGVYGNRITYIEGDFAQGMACAITTGYTAETLPPGIAAAVLRIAGDLYKYREIYQDGNLDVMPGWMDQLLGGYWIPRV